MSRALAKMLGASEQVVAEMVAKLESLSGNASEDLRLLHDNQQTVRTKLAQLGLDPNDTTSRELYEALKVKFAADSQRLDKSLKVSIDAPLADKIHKATNLVENLLGHSEVWAVKSTKLKSLIRQQPPKRLMKTWGYRSLDSLLKRESPEKICLLAQYSEPASWQVSFKRLANKLSSADFTERPIKLIVVNQITSQSEAATDVMVNKLAGAVAIYPSQRLENANILALASKLLQVAESLGAKPQKSIYSVHPALHWWQNAEHLMLADEGGRVSFNLHDAATNYDLNFVEHSAEQGISRFWQSLVDRYRQHSGQISQLVPEIESALGLQSVQIEDASLEPKLAAETVEA